MAVKCGQVGSVEERTVLWSVDCSMQFDSKRN